jgi:septum formation protein
MIHHRIPLILASGSAIRQKMLESVGLNCSVVPSGVDEDAVKTRHAADPAPFRAQKLAEAKALSVAKHYPEHLTIGADQMCELDGRVLSKPGSYERAEAQLAELSGRTHFQHSGVAIARGETLLWSHVESATLTLRTLTPEEIKAYVAADAPLASCGAYKFEAMGRHLFAQVEGNNDTIQGLPLVRLLAALYDLDAISLHPFSN